MGHDNNVANQHQHMSGQPDRTRAKKVYNSPELKVHGSIQEHTLAGSGSTNDGPSYS